MPTCKHSGSLVLTRSHLWAETSVFMQQQRRPTSSGRSQEDKAAPDSRQPGMSVLGTGSLVIEELRRAAMARAKQASSKAQPVSFCLCPQASLSSTASTSKPQAARLLLSALSDIRKHLAMGISVAACSWNSWGKQPSSIDQGPVGTVCACRLSAAKM